MSQGHFINNKNKMIRRIAEIHLKLGSNSSLKLLSTSWNKKFKAIKYLPMCKRLCLNFYNF